MQEQGEADCINSDGDKYINSSHTYQQKRFTKARQNYENTVKRHGKLCKSLGLYIVNGKTKGDSLGRLTYCSYLGSSIVDYAITDLDYFTVMPQLPLSDHSHIVLSLNRSVNLLPSSEKVKLYPLPSKFIWSKDSPDQHEAELHSCGEHDRLISTDFIWWREENNQFRTGQLIKTFSTVVRKSLRKRKHYRCKK